MLRTPLMPFELAARHGVALASPQAITSDALDEALDRDRGHVESAVRDALADPVVRDALFVASPSLDDAITQWIDDAAHPRARGVLGIVTRYLARMSARPTPFGLFSGCSVGRVARATRLEVAPRAEATRRTRLDMHYLCALAEALEAAHRDALRFAPSTALYASADQLRYAEGRVDPVTRARRNDVVSVDRGVGVEAALARARGGALPAEIARHVAEVVEVTVDEARGFVDALIASQLLVSELAPAITGEEPVRGVVETLRALQAPEFDALSAAADALAALDRAGPGRAPAEYRAVRDTLSGLPATPDIARLFQVDLYKPAPGLTLGDDVLDEVARAVTTLAAVVPDAGDVDLERFCDRFVARWGHGEVALTDALDEDRGIGFGEGHSGDASPLLAGLAFPDAGEVPTARAGARLQWLLRRVEECLADGRTEWTLDARDLAALAVADARPLPDAFAVMATVASRSPEALAAGEFSVHVQGASGPSGARLLGRFCLGDAALRAHVEAHLRAEEALRPDAVFAEVVHLPDGRLGNILARPVLREHEIAYLGRSGAPAHRQITLDDLRVSVSERGPRRVVLRSARLDREVIPRLTSAHNTSTGLTPYRFLTALQAQGARPGLAWSWGALAGARFLPRVRSGHAVLALAQWRLFADDLGALARDTVSQRYAAVQALRARLRLPRRVGVADGDNVLPVDLDEPVSVETFVALVKGRTEALLQEMYPGPDALCAFASDGRYTHELVIPYVRAEGPSVTGVDPRPVHITALPRAFAPGSEWLYAKVYTGSATVDAVLTHAVRPVIDQALGEGAADAWFFIRYADPDWHLRVRLHGDPARLCGQTLPRLHAALAPWMADGRVARWTVDTYDRETERYGGDAGIALAEALFHVDSVACADIVAQLEGDEGAAARWRLACRGARDLLRDLGLPRERRIRVLERARAGYFTRFRGDADFDGRIGQRFRDERAGLERLFAATAESAHAYAPGIAALERRGAALAPIAARLASAPLTSALDDIATSYVHMFVNRLLRSEHNEQELVLYDFAMRIERSEEARARALDRGRGG